MRGIIHRSNTVTWQYLQQRSTPLVSHSILSNVTKGYEFGTLRDVTVDNRIYMVDILLLPDGSVAATVAVVRYCLKTIHASQNKLINPVTCMDARIDPAAAFGINLGDAHVIRNAGGNARDAIRSLIISEQLLGTNETLLIKHTGCGMMTFKNEDVYAVVETQLGPGAKEELAGLDFQPFPHLEDGVKDDIEFLRRSKAIPDSVTISGWVYEIESGKVRQVV